MRLTALAQPRKSGPDRRLNRRGRMPAIVMAVLALGACSNWRLGDGSPRQPSLRVADAALAAGAPEMALRIAELAIAKQPRNVQALIARGDALYAMGQRDMAQQAYRAAVAIDPTAAGGQVGLGRILVQSDPRAAEAAFLAALTHEPDNVIALNNLGVTRDLQGRNTEAQEAYRRALAVSPESADVQVNLGMSLALSGHTDEAVQLLRSVAADPGQAQAWRKELIAALTLAGDGQWARQVLQNDLGQPAPEAPPASERVRIASVSVPSPSLLAADRNAAVSPRPASPAEVSGKPLIAVTPASIGTPAPDAAPRIPVARTDIPLIAPKVAPAPRLALEQILAVATPADTGVAEPSPPVPEPTMRVAAARPAASEPLVAADHDTATGELVAPKKSRTLGGDPYVQLASLVSEPGAMFEWRRLSKRMFELLAGRGPTITRAEVHGRTYWRLRTFGFASISEARGLCNRVKAAGRDCLSGLDR